MAQQPKKVAFLLANDFIDSEMRNPYDALTKNGNEAVIISLVEGQELTGKDGMTYTSHFSIEKANPNDYEAVIIPGGKSPSNLLKSEKVPDFVRRANEAGTTIAAICHGPELLVKAGVIQGRSLTANPELETAIHDAGGQFIDQAVVVDKNLITSRKPEDEPFFIEEIIKKLGVTAY
jgi:protease I